MVHDTTVKAAKLVDALTHFRNAKGTLITAVPTEIDPQSGRVQRYLVV
jgi:hypothetical protein